MIIREAKLEDALGIAKVKVDTWNTTYRGLIHDDYIDSLEYNDRAKRWQLLLEKNESIILVAVINDTIIGYAYGGKNRDEQSEYDGELYALYVLEAYQRKGVGKKLFLSFVDSLKKVKYQSMLIWVLKGNPSYHFYEKMGGKKLKTQAIVFDNHEYLETSYGWKVLDF